MKNNTKYNDNIQVTSKCLNENELVIIRCRRNYFLT